MTDTDAAGPETNGAGAPEPGIRILAQFIRDLSFENPRAPESLRAGLRSNLALAAVLQARKPRHRALATRDLVARRRRAARRGARARQAHRRRLSHPRAGRPGSASGAGHPARSARGNASNNRSHSSEAVG